MDNYKTIYIDGSNHIKSKLNPYIIGDDLAREIEKQVNDMDAMGYHLNRIISPAQVAAGYVMTGMILLFEKNERTNL